MSIFTLMLGAIATNTMVLPQLKISQKQISKIYYPKKIFYTNKHRQHRTQNKDMRHFQRKHTKTR
jgi:hypothetical protein